MPGTTLGQIIREREANLFVGRGDALAELDNLVNNNWPLVFFLHGIPGVGKTALINKFLLGAPALKTQVLQLDGETIEPTFDGFRAALGAPASATDDRSLIVIDNYEHLLLLDDWLREQLVPFLTANVRLILISRLPPNIGWMTRPASRGIFKAWELTGLETADAVELLQSGALPDYQINRAVELAQGHPLTLVLASTALGNASDTISLQDELAKVSGELAHLFLMDIDDQTLRPAVELGALARRLDHSLLSFMFPRADAGLLHEQLSKLPFVESRADGLKLHQVIAGAVLAAMESENPDKVVQLRRTIWRYLRARDHSRGGGGCGGRQSWRNTVDMIYQLHNPVVREAFFPSGAPPRFVENATAADFDKVMSITEAHDGADMVKIISLWWQLVPAAFRIVRDDGNQVVGYCVATDDHRVPEQLRRMDPLLDAWVRNAKAETQARKRSLFVRRWLSETAGESPSPEQGAS